jgi:hypothetical protein
VDLCQHAEDVSVNTEIDSPSWFVPKIWQIFDVGIAPAIIAA